MHTSQILMNRASALAMEGSDFPVGPDGFESGDLSLSSSYAFGHLSSPKPHEIWIKFPFRWRSLVASTFLSLPGQLSSCVFNQPPYTSGTTPGQCPLWLYIISTSFYTSFNTLFLWGYTVMF